MCLQGLYVIEKNLQMRNMTHDQSICSEPVPISTGPAASNSFTRDEDVGHGGALRLFRQLGSQLLSLVDEEPSW